MGECYVNGHHFNDIMEIETLSREDFKMRCVYNMPTSLFRYFPNTFSQNCMNHSFNALETNEVFMQDPKQFNDPYDSYFCINNEQFISEKLKYYLCLAKINFTDENTNDERLVKFAEYVQERLGKPDFWTRQNSLELAESSDKTNSEKKYLECVLFENRIKCNLVHNQKLCPTISHAIYQALLSHITEDQTYKDFKVSCFTVKNDNMLMWSHYANSHKGFCIEYEIPPVGNGSNELHQNLYPVIYCNDMSDVTKEILVNSNNNLGNEELHNLYIKALLRKGLDWKYEQEWRLLFYSKTRFPYVFFPIKKVYLGHYMPFDERAKIIKFCKENSIPYIGMKADSKTYKMIECNVLCEVCDKYKDKGVTASFFYPKPTD